MPATSSNSIIRFLEETTPGVIESGGPQVYRTTDGTLSQTTQSSEDNELRADRGRGDSTLVSGSVSGPLNINWSHKTHDDFLEALLANTFTRVGTDGVVTVSDAVFTGSSEITSAGSEFPSLEKGQWFSISGSTYNNGIYKTSSSIAPTTGSITVDTAVKDTTVESSGSVVLSSSRLKQANSSLRTFTLERELADVNQFFTWPGTYVSSLALNYSVTDKLSGNFGFMAQESEQQGTASKFPGIGSEVDPTTTPYFNAVTGTSVLLDGVAMGESCAESLAINIDGSLRERKCLGGGLSATSIGFDQFKISFTASIFFGTAASAALYQKKLLDSALSFSVCLTDSEGNGVAVTIPRGKITSAEVTGGSLGSDVMLSLNVDAVTDPTEDTMIIFDTLGSVA